LLEGSDLGNTWGQLAVMPAKFFEKGNTIGRMGKPKGVRNALDRFA
jgi:hypothetical protein